MNEVLAIVAWLCMPPIMPASKYKACESYYVWCLRRKNSGNPAQDIRECVKERKGKL